VSKKKHMFENRHTAISPTLYKPGDPATTKYVEKCWRIANIAAGMPAYQRPTRMYLSATDFGAIIAELRAQHDAPWHMADPPYLVFGKNPEFRVLNAGTDSEREVNRLNNETPGAVEFTARSRQFIW